MRATIVEHASRRAAYAVLFVALAAISFSSSAVALQVDATGDGPVITVTGDGVAEAGKPYQVDVSVDGIEPKSITSWTVSWGDGTTETKKGRPGKVNHKYDVVGLTYDITASVTTEAGTWTSADVVVPMYDATSSIMRIEAPTGAGIADLGVSSPSIDSAYAAVVGPDGLVYVSGNASDTVERYDPSDNSHVDTFVSAGSGGLDAPKGMAFGPDGNLYVASSGSGEVLRYSAESGAPIDPLVGAGRLGSPTDLVFGTDGHLYVSDRSNDAVERFDGASGQYIDTFARLEPGASPAGLAWAPNGNLFVAASAFGRVEEFDGTSGQQVRALAAETLEGPSGLRIGPDGTLWVADYWTNEIHRFDTSNGRFLETLADDVRGPQAFTFLPGHQVSIAEAGKAPKPKKKLTLDEWLEVDVGTTRATGLSFEKNDGSASEELDFVARGADYDAVLTDGDVVLALGDTPGDSVRMDLQGAAVAPPVKETTALAVEADGPGIEYDEVYSGIDVQYTANGDELEYSFVVAPGADPTTISLDFPDAADVVLDETGDLRITTASGLELLSTAPLTFQDIAGEQRPIESSYDIRADGSVGFTAAAFDATQPLIIDPTFRSAASTTANSTTIVLTKPAGVVANDLLIAQVAFKGGPPVITPPSGWVLIRTDFVNTAFSQSAYYKVATASEPTNYTFTFNSSAHSSGGIGAYSGVDTTSPIDAHGGAGLGVGPDFTAPSITTTVANTTLVALFGNRMGSAITPPPGMTERWDAFNNIAAEGADETFAGVGSTGTRTTATDPGGPRVAQLIALAPAQQTFVVNSTGDASDNNIGNGACNTGGLNSQGAAECTLRAALEEANFASDANDINFAIPQTESGYSASPEAFTIQPLAVYPDIIHPVSIDGSTQAEYTTAPVIQLDGSSAGTATAGLVLETTDSLIKALLVHSFWDEGLEIDGSTGSGHDNVFADNWIGFDASLTPLGVGDAGILVTHGATPGNVLDGNVVGNSTTSGIVVRVVGTDDTTVTNNLLGVAPDGTTPMPNGLHGIHIYDQVTNTVVQGNVVANHPGDGIFVDATSGSAHAFLANSIHDNAGLGIDLGNDGVTANSNVDAWLNYPTVTGAVESAGTVTVDFDIDLPAGDYRIEFFVNPTGADTSGFGEGETFVDFYDVVAHAGGVGSYSTTVTGLAGDVLTATSTEDLGGGTYGSSSEFAGNFTVIGNRVWVNSTGDLGDATPGDDICDTGATNSVGAPECTLRAAIEEANVSALVDTIEFDIPITEPGYSPAPLAFTITPGTILPTITAPVVMDATTQAQYTTRPVIQLDGKDATGATAGILIEGNNVTVSGFIVHSFDDEGIEIDDTGASGDNNIIINNWIGIDASEATKANLGDGILVTTGSANNTIGSPGQGNIISGNGRSGVLIRGLNGDDNVVEGNLIGVGSNGSTPIPNGLHGVEIGASTSGNRVGGTLATEANTIANNGGDGVAVLATAGPGHSILGNDIHSNIGLGIDVENDGVTANSNVDAWVNYPDNIFATETAGTITVDFDLDLPAGDYRIELFKNPGGADPSTHGEGETYVDFHDVVSHPGGVVSYSTTTAGTVGDIITATTSEVSVGPVYGATSEFSLAATVATPNTAPVLDPIGAQAVDETVLLAFTATASDGDVPADTLTFTLEDGVDTVPAGAAITAGGNFTWTPTETQGGATYSFKIRVTDDGTGTLFDEEEIVFTVNDTNVAPVLSPIGDRSVVETVPLSFTLSATDADVPSDTLTYSAVGLPTGATLNPTTGAFAWAPTAAQGPGVYPITFTVTDDGAGTLSDSEAMTITVDDLDLTVNSTGDAADATVGDGRCDTGGTNSGGATECTLRAAIQEANALAGANDIKFNIPTTEPGYSAAPLAYTIQPGSFLGFITSPVTLDATTQPDHVADPIIQLDGSLATGATAGLSLRTNDSEIRGFIVHSFDDDGLEIDGQTGFGDNNVIAGNWVGFDHTGAPQPNIDAGFVLALGANGNQIGGTGPLDANVIGSNATAGLQIREATSLNNVVIGNLIGVLPDGTTPRPNGTYGIQVHVGAHDNRIGGPLSTEANLIAHSTLDGVFLSADAGSGNAILGNEIRNNGGLGIELNADAVTPNDAGDVDAGPNDLLNFPEVTSATESGGTVTVDFDLDVPAGDYRVEIFTNPSGADPSGNGEGETFETAYAVVAHPGGSASYSTSYTGGAVGDIVAATATEESAGPVYGSTSEFSTSYTVPPNSLLVNSTGDASDAIPGNGTCDTGGTNSGGAPECTLRAAIEEANAFAGADPIAFAMPASEPGHSGGIWTIAPGSQLPTLSTTIDLDATTQPGWTNTPIVEVNGAGAGGTTDGLHVSGDGVTISGFAINRFLADGIKVLSGAANTTIQSNHIGLDATGLIDRGNGARGIDLQSGSGPTTIGGTNAIDRNVISGNGDDGIVVWGSSNNTIIGNYIGTDATGLASGPGIGNAADGMALGNGSSGNTIGQAGAGNVFAGNLRDGVEIDDVSPNNAIQGNLIGIGRDGVTAVPNGRHGVVLYNGVNNTQIGGTVLGDENVISANVRSGIVIDGNANALTANNVVEGNFIGTDASGLLPRGNGENGISIFNGANTNVIGGASPLHRNVIAANIGYGIDIVGTATDANVVSANYIGVDGSGTSDMGNTTDGVAVRGGAKNTVVGGATIGERNVIAGNDNDGVWITGAGTTGTTVQGNWIGLGSDASNIGNTLHGVAIENGASDTLVGGATSAAANRISYSGWDGVAIVGTGTKNTVIGNEIWSNTGLGIDLDNDGVTPNSGADAWLDYPTITSATESGGTVTVDFDLDVPAGDYRVEIFTNPSGADGTGHGEGETFETAYAVVSHPGGPASYSTSYTGAVGDIVSSTATEESAGPTYGATSEFSATFTATGTAGNTAPVLDPIGDQAVDELVSLAFTVTATDADAGSAVKVSDSFTEAGNTALTSHTPDIGTGWTEVFDSSAATTDATIDAALDILEGGSDQNDVGQAYTAQPAPTSADQSVSFRLSAIEPGTGTKPVGLFGRRVDNNNFYLLKILPNPHALDSLKLIKFAGGVQTELATIDATLAAGDTFKLDLTDTAKKVFHNGSEVLSSPDNALTAAGTWGLFFGDFNGASGNHLRPTWGVDDFLAEEPGADVLTFSASGLPTGATLNPVTGDFEWTPTEAQGPGVYPVTFTVTDDGTPNLDDSEAINITVNDTNTAPVLDPVGAQAVDETVLLAFTATATDSDDPADTLTFTLEPGTDAVPAGAAITAGGNFTWTPTETQGGATYSFKIRVTDDGTGTLLDEEEIVFTINDTNTAPVLAAIGDQSVVETTPLSFSISGTDADDPTDTLTYSATGLPPGATLNPTTGAFAWTPTAGQGPGVYPITFTVTDDGTPNLDDSEAINITVNEIDLTVNSTGDTPDASPGDGLCDTGGINSGGATECTLRAAIEEANAFAGADTLTFTMPVTEPGHSAGIWTIAPTTALPVVNSQLVIDATTQVGYSNPVVRLDGNAAVGATGVQVGGSGDLSQIHALMITDFDVDGISVDVGAAGVEIRDNWIGSDGTGAAAMGNGDDGIDLFGTNAVIDGNVVNHSNDEGIDVGGSGATITGNNIGLEADGANGAGNTDVGIAVFAANTTIGGNTAVERNVISMNFEGIVVNTSGNTIQGNYIGTDATGVLDRGNRLGDGIEIQAGDGNLIGGTGANDANLIAFNQLKGVDVTGGTNNAIVSNVIHSNGGLGIDLGATGVTPNDAGDPDVGANDLLNHPEITSATISGTIVTISGTFDVPAGNYRFEFFKNPSGADPSGNGEGELLVGTSTLSHSGAGPQGFGGAFPGAMGDLVSITITEESAGPVYGSTSEFSATAQVVGPLFVNSTGDAPDPTPSNGNCDTGAVNSEGDPECTLRAAIETANGSTLLDTIDFAIPDSDPGFVNLGAGNSYWTIQPAAALPVITGNDTTIDGTSQATYATGQGYFFNSLGPSIELDGSTAAATGLEVTADNTTIRALAINRFDTGIALTGGDNNTLAGNYIGPDVTGLVGAVGNTSDGIYIYGATNSTIGGPTAADRNVISGNRQRGIWINDWTDGAPAISNGTVVLGNYIGTDANGASALPYNGVGDSQQMGVALWNGPDNIIGGAGVGEGNVISGNSWHGLYIWGVDATANVVQSNIIGLDSSATLAIGNGSDDPTTRSGLVLSNAPGNLVGGPNPGDGNTIAGNDAAGAAVTSSVGNSFLGNEFFDNDGIALDLGTDGITLNDLGDVDAGPNDYLNHPVVTGGNETAGTVTLDIDLDVPAGDYRIEVFTNPGGADPSGQGEGEVFVDVATITHTGSGVESFQVGYPGTGSELVTLTATELSAGPVYGSTSEFSTAVAAGSFVVNSAADASDTNIGDHICDTGALNSAGDRECTLRAAIEEANASAIVDEIRFDVPTSDPGHVAGIFTISPGAAALPAISAGVLVDAMTQPGYATSPVIALDGSATAALSNGFLISGTGAGTTIRGLAIINFPDDGIDISGSTSGVVISDNHIGVGTDGLTAGPNGDDGIDDNGSGNLTITDNIVSSNSGAGIQLEGAVGTVTGNKIGVGVDGVTALGNGTSGILVRNGASAIVIGGTAGADQNIIANNGSGVVLDPLVPSSTIAILGNAIFDNGDHGIDLEADGPTPNDIGDGDAGSNDLLNVPEIVNVRRVAGDLIVDFTLDVPAGSYRVELFGNSAADASGFGEGETPIGGGSIIHTGSGVESFTVSGTSAATILTSTATVDLGAGSFGGTSEFSAAVPSPDLVIVNSTDDAADSVLGDGQCDTGGTNSDGDPECTLRAALEEVNDLSTPVDTVWFAIPATDPGHNAGVWTIAPGSILPTIGRTASIDGSTQSGHVPHTVAAPGALDGTQVLVVDGSSAGPGTGLTIAATDTEVRGLVIGGFDGNGVEIAGARAIVSDVYVGTSVDGSTANANTGHGIAVSAADATIGGVSPGDRVLVSGNAQQGIEVGGSSTSILGAVIGLDATATVALPNQRNGIRLGAATDAIIGAVGAGNVIAGNNLAAGAADGIFISGGSGHTIQANVIGTNTAGAALGNFNAGVAVDSATAITIGGVTAAEANSIAHNGGDGIQITGATSAVTSVGNNIWSNGDLGLDLGNDGPSANDSGDGDAGPNNLLNTPVIGSASVSGSTVTLDYTLDVPAGTYRVEFFTNSVGADPSGFGEGETLVATASMGHAGAGPQAGSVVFTGAPGAIITATATEDLGAGAFGVSSEHSGNVTALDVALALIDDRTVRRSDVLAAGGLDIATNSTPGLAGTALDFDGSNDRLVGPALDVTDNALSISAWINADVLVGQPRVVSKVNSGGVPIYELSVDSATGEAVVALRVGGSTISARGGSVAAGSWHRIAAVWDGAELALNLDGLEVDRVAAVGSLASDVATAVVLGNNAASSQPFDGRIDDVRIVHSALPTTTLATEHTNAIGAGLVSVGAEQTSTPGAWSTSGVQTRSGSFALSAPETSGSGAAAWAVATGIDEPGLVFESWWWFSSDTGIDLASGTRAGTAPTDQYEAALTSPSGWELRQRSGGSGSFDAPAAGGPTAGTWMEVEIWTDQFGDTRLFIDNVEVTTSTPQGSALLSGSMALRAGLLPTGQNWYVDDARGRKLVTPEPLTSVGPLDRN